MGITRGKQPLGIEIGKVHKIMDATALVFRDATSSLDDLIARVQENPLHLTLADVTIEEPGHPIEGRTGGPSWLPTSPGCTMRPSMKPRSLMAPTEICSS